MKKNLRYFVTFLFLLAVTFPGLGAQKKHLVTHHTQVQTTKSKTAAHQITASGSKPQYKWKRWQGAKSPAASAPPRATNRAAGMPAVIGSN